MRRINETLQNVVFLHLDSKRVCIFYVCGVIFKNVFSMFLFDVCVFLCGQFC